jgi:hypothetical protein
MFRRKRTSLAGACGSTAIVIAPLFGAAALASPPQGTCTPLWTDKLLGVGAYADEGVPAFTLSGDTLAIGAYNHASALGLYVGRVRLFQNDGTGWQVVATLEPSAGYPAARYGWGVDFGGDDRLVVGAPGDAYYGYPASWPRAYVYDRVGSTWIETARLVGWDTAGGNDWFGASVSISANGDTIAVGAPFNNDGYTGLFQQGAVYVFDRVPGSGNWVPMQRLTVSNAASGDIFGISVAIDASGDVLIAGASDNGAYVEGAGFVFVRTPSGWVEEARLPMSSFYWYEGAGMDVAIDASGTVAVVGAPWDNEQGIEAGAAFVYRRSASGWAEEDKLFPGDPVAYNHFAVNVAIDSTGERIYASGRGAVTAGVVRGATYVFDRVGNGWIQSAKVIDPAGQFGDGFGGPIALSFDSSRLAIAAMGDDTAAISAGAVHVFESPCQGPETYCTAKQNSLGCWPVMRFNGHPSAWDGSAFELQAHRVLNQKFGWLVYGVSGRAALPFGGGLLCMNPPARRTPMQNSGGSTTGRDCTGTFSFDFNEWIASEADPALHVGARVQAQYISRDPAASFGLSLTDAVEFLVEP